MGATILALGGVLSSAALLLGHGQLAGGIMLGANLAALAHGALRRWGTR